MSEASRQGWSFSSRILNDYLLVKRVCKVETDIWRSTLCQESCLPALPLTVNTNIGGTLLRLSCCGLRVLLVSWGLALLEECVHVWLCVLDNGLLLLLLGMRPFRFCRKFSFGTHLEYDLPLR